MKIGLDVMGGDFAPASNIDGALLAIKELHPEDKIVLIGDSETIQSYLESRQVKNGLFEIVHAHDVIGMGEKPIRAIQQKPESSISIGFSLLKNKKIQAFASAGNSGAMLVGALYSVGSIPGIIRPCTIVPVPKENGGTSVLLDVGTNPDARPDLLHQFAILGKLYAQFIYKIDNPRVGLLNIGEEAEKGNLLTQAAHELMKESDDYFFYGNIEGRDLFKDKADVIVCDGFTGNIVVKLVESFYRLLMKRNLADNFIHKLNYENHGGSPILGINGTVLIGHGISNDRAVKNMLLLTKDVHEAHLSARIKKVIDKYIQ